MSRKIATPAERGADGIDALFKLPLAEFTAARNALAARLKKSGRADEAAQVKGLLKPPISAWTVNQLFWDHRPAFDALLEAGKTFRTAQAEQLEGRAADMRGPLQARREALADLSTRAARILRHAGHAASPDVVRRITTTLEALSTYAGLPEAPAAGRLTDDVDPPGFETLAALVPRVGKRDAAAGPSRVLAFQQQKAARKKTAKIDPAAARAAAVAAAKRAMQSGEQGVREARRQAEQAETQLKKAAARTKDAERVARDIEKEKAAIDRKYEKAAAAAEAAREEARRVAQAAEAAAQAVDDAERHLERARRDLAALSEE